MLKVAAGTCMHKCECFNKLFDEGLKYQHIKNGEGLFPQHIDTLYVSLMFIHILIIP